MNRLNPILFILAALSVTIVGCQKDNDIPENQVPTADAGPSKAITLPKNSTTLTGTGKDTDGQVVAYLWSQVSGPSATTIVNPGSASTLIKSFVEGTYVFQLMVTDNKGATGVDTTSVVVNPAQEQTLTLQPANNPNEFEYLNHNGVDNSASGAPDIPVEAWTSGGTPWTVREAIKFDLSTIPASSTIISANLYLYSYPNPTINGNLVDANYGSNNAMLVQQIVTNWSPSTTNWFNQPVTSTNNQIVVPSTSQSTLDLNLDVTSMVASMVNSNANYGFFLKLQNEEIYNSRIFVSSYNTSYPTKRPKLVVVYQ